MLIIAVSGLILVQIMGVNKKLLRTFSNQNRPDDLIKFLIKSNSIGQTSGTAPVYKFYSEIVDELIKSRNRFGSEVRSSLREIRKALILDVREERKVKDAILAGYFQYVFMSVFVWIFIIVAMEIIDLKKGGEGYLFVGGWQIIGGIILVLTIRFYKKKIFDPFPYYFQSLYQMKALVQSKRPISEVINCFDTQKRKTTTDFKVFSDRIESLCLQMKLKGSLDVIEFDYLLSEIWDHFELQFLKFSKLLVAVKMFSVLLFMLPSFFLSIGLIFSQIAVFE